MDQSKPLQDKVALVTGAGRGIGRAIALALAEAGAGVIVTDIHLAPYAGEQYYRLKKRFSGEDEKIPTAQVIVDLGGRACEYALDVADSSAVDQLSSVVENEFGAVDILVNNAGIVNNIATIAEMDVQSWRREIEINLTGGFNCTKVLAPKMAANGWGRVVNISSVAAKMPGLGQPSYSASKAGVVAFTQSIAQEFGPYGVTANAIMPGLIGTPLVRSMPEQIRERSVARVPVQRLGEPEDIANLARFLCLPDSGFITAAAIPCDGGLLGAPLGGLS